MGYLMAVRHLSPPELMQDLPWLLLCPVIDLSALTRSQKEECLTCYLGVDREELYARDEGIAPEWCGEPGYSRRERCLTAVLYHERPKIGDRLVECRVEVLIIAMDLGRDLMPLLIGLSYPPESL